VVKVLRVLRLNIRHLPVLPDQALNLTLALKARPSGPGFFTIAGANPIPPEFRKEKK
jgi:hypothetical protein